ncbi:MAG: zinc ribbon domain-containing protein [Candidatus Muirbacterium halophilum]|nr:zinc ribbon domain-containing protein [Candidatus Muirbacterium halophilum]MCK9477465.1 zinc ribbon domain-containing protein [Candidatus Muirbacterium halophilum]
MPSVRKSYQRLENLINEYDFIKLLDQKNKKDVVLFDLFNIKKTVLLKNEILEPIYEEENDSYNCRVCGEQVLLDFNFCPYCSQKIK